MTDNRTCESRSALMARIGGKNTTPEHIVRRRLHGLGYRFRLHAKNLPGRPDIVFPGRRKAIFVHGCFWHAHGCKIGQPPKSRLDYWAPKLEANRVRDAATEAALRAMGWETLTVWQCQLRTLDALTADMVAFLVGKKPDRQAGAKQLASPPDMAEARQEGIAVRPIGIDLFAGAGGLSLGFEQAGFEVVGAVEIDPIHAAVHKFNFPRCAVLPRSVVGLTGAKIREVAGIGSRQVDVVFGGAPCQGFSLIGQRVLDDPRNSLVREFVRIVGELQASYFVFENVKGLTVGSHRAFLDELIAAFDAIGYCVLLPWQVIDAADHGTPQHRERLFLYGARKGLPLPAYPEKATRPADNEWRTQPKGPTCEDALGDLPDADAFDALLDSDEVLPGKWREPSAYAREMRCLTNDAWHFGHVREWNPAVLTSSARTDHTDISRRRFAATVPGEVEPISRFFKLSGAGLSNTLRAGTDAARGAFTSPRPIHYALPRCVTVREMARLHGFPDWFRFHTTKWHGARQIGNSVPPPLGRAVAGALMKALGVEPVRPSGKMLLGDPALIRMDMSEASAYFGIENPIGRRDRKSGAKKRSQHEVESQRHMAQGEVAFVGD